MNRIHTPIRLFLVRHGRAFHNDNIGKLENKVDALSGLTPEGWQQAESCGQFFKTFFDNSPPEGESIILTTPFDRGLQTAQGIFNAIGDRVETVLPVNAFVEQDFGDISGLNEEKQRALFPDFKVKEDIYKIGDATFYLKAPGGESLLNVCHRVRGTFPALHRMHERGVTDIIIVSHSRTSRCIATEWLNIDYRAIFRESPPGNCDVRFINRGEDFGYIYKSGVPQQPVRVDRPAMIDKMRAGQHRPRFDAKDLT